MTGWSASLYTRLMNAEQMADKLVLWIKGKAKATGSNGVVFGMSGGLDSSVVAILCRRALGDNALGLIMPCHSNPRDEQDALASATKFSVPVERIVLNAAYDSLLESLSTAGDTDADRIARANLKARLRMTTLYYHANKLGYMVVGSGNKSELAIGYFTKYGDGGVDILPLGNLVKGQVRQLAAYLGVPQSIIDKPPSAGLWQGQTDEAEMGCSYNELDRCLTGGELSDALKGKIEQMEADNRHKLNPPPIPGF